VYLGPYVEHAYAYPTSKNLFDVSEAIGEALHAGDEHDGKIVWMRNVGRAGVTEFGDLDDAGETDLSEVEPNEEIARFKQAFASELAALVKHYGELTFRFGLVRRWS
jgi:hypothetical protein